MSNKARAAKGVTASPMISGAMPEHIGPYSILVVEDNGSDVFLFERALTRQHLDFQLTHLRDGGEALAFVRREAPYDNMPPPDLILVDLNLPKIDGEEIIRQIRNARHLDGVPACVWSSSESLRDRESLNRLGVDEFIFKPSGLEQFMQIGKTIRDLLCRGLVAPRPAFT
jgi:chemotaxis family two-component system response regulator Rcp1